MSVFVTGDGDMQRPDPQRYAFPAEAAGGADDAGRAAAREAEADDGAWEVDGSVVEQCCAALDGADRRTLSSGRRERTCDWCDVCGVGFSRWKQSKTGGARYDARA